MITVIPGHRGRHIFEGIRDNRVRVLDALTDGMPDLIVFPCGQDRRLEKASAITIPENVRQSISEGRVGLIFDASTEGIPHKPDLSAALHATIDRLHATPGQCVYVTQDRNYEADYRTHCAAAGCAHPVRVMVHDYWIWNAVSHFAANGEAVFSQRFEAFKSRKAYRTRRFLSLNRTPRPIKILFLLRLLRDGLWNSAFISFGGFKLEGDGPGKAQPSRDDMIRALRGFEDVVDDLMPQMESLAGVGRQLLGMKQHRWDRLELWNAGMAADLAEYDDSWFSVVTETEMRPRPTRITEKILKPLVNFQPLIVFGNPGALKMIREYGFQTFDDVIDESYDEELDPRRRFDHAYAELTRLCRMDEAALARMERVIEDRLTFNARWGLTRLSTDIRAARDRVLVDALVRLPTAI
jgi:hypothetical protein